MSDMDQQTSGSNKRIVWIDLLRCIAILCVVLCHATEAVYDFDLESMTPIRPAVVLAFTLFTIGRTGVPIFLMVTGYLLLDRPYDEGGAVRFWKRNLLGLLLTVEIWIVIYDLFLAWYHGYEANPVGILADMLFLQKVDMSHFWYMPMILGMYLFIPFVAAALQHFDTKTIMIPLAIASCFLFGVPLANVVLETLKVGTLSEQLSLDFSGGVYGILIVVGYLFKKDAFKDVKKGWYAAALVGGLLGTLALELWATGNGNLYTVWYDNPLICLASWGIFGLVQGADEVPLPDAVQHLGTCSFGIYLAHKPIMMVLNRWLEIARRPMKVFALFLFSLGISWAAVELVSLVPEAGRVLFFMKGPERTRGSSEEDAESGTAG